MSGSLRNQVKKTMTKASPQTQIAVMAEQIRSIDETVRDIKRKMEADFVTQDQFMPIQKLVYGLVTIILTAVIGGIIALVIKK